MDNGENKNNKQKCTSTCSIVLTACADLYPDHNGTNKSHFNWRSTNVGHQVTIN